MGIAYLKALKLLAGSRRWSTPFKAVDFDDGLEHSEARAEADESGELREHLEQGLARLSPEQRAVVELTYFGGCSYQEIAAITASSVHTVKTRMFHARAKLRNLLPALDECEPPP